MKDTMATVIASSIIALVVLVLLSIPVSWGWYKAGVQSAVYQREGIELSQWEVFVGAKPAERTINVR